MSNHYHVVLHINTDQQRGWSDADIVARWERLHQLPEWFESAHEEKIAATIAIWRERLGSISWCMKCLNEPLARLANKEDGCKGRFWEGRFKSQALLDDAAVLKCMAYVDLNPVRANMAATPEDSAHTSIQARIESRDQALAPMAGQQADGFVLSISKADYVTLVDWTGRQFRRGKRGRIDATQPPIIDRLQRSSRRTWLDEMKHLTHHYFRAIGNIVSLSDYHATTWARSG